LDDFFGAREGLEPRRQEIKKEEKEIRKNQRECFPIGKKGGSGQGRGALRRKATTEDQAIQKEAERKGFTDCILNSSEKHQRGRKGVSGARE